ncbi:MAG TPA: hypothetical protein VM492_02900, partial [Sumerlaeia bacterium]|nr:hypothetical protein [Sumerlaeia bacterium]
MAEQESKEGRTADQAGAEASLPTDPFSSSPPAVGRPDPSAFRLHPLSLLLHLSASLRLPLTIVRYELLMQIKSIRFKGMCALALLFGFGLFQTGVYSQELRPSGSFLSMKVLPFYLLAIVFAGLFSMGRIRKTGM